MSDDERRRRREHIVWRLYNEGWVHGDFDLVCRLVAPTVVWTAIESAPDAGTYVGHEGVRSYMQDWLDDFELEEGALEESIEMGDLLVCVQHARGTGRASGVPSELRYACVYTFDADDRIVELHEYATRDEALTAARG